jgi:hypothetical protein
VHLVGFYYKNIPLCTVLRISNPIVIAIKTRLSSTIQPVIAMRTSSTLQPVIAMRTNCFRRKIRLSSPALCLPPPLVQRTLHLLQHSGLVSGGQTRESILAGFKFRALFLLASNDIGVRSAVCISYGAQLRSVDSRCILATGCTLTVVTMVVCLVSGAGVVGLRI